jgi:hypothetical protein
MTPEQFINKWAAAALSERSAAQQHFLDLCSLPGEPTPAWPKAGAIVGNPPFEVGNPNGRRNGEVLKPWWNGLDVTRRARDMDEASAAQYAAPFAYVAEHVRPERAQNRRELYRTFWWRHVEPRPGDSTNCARTG